MVTLISFFILLLGAFNWFSIGLMQYDFIAGIFGTQSSFLSRAIYIVVGFAAIWIIIMAFVQKGKIKINDNGFKKDPLKAEKGRNVARAVEYDRDFGERRKQEIEPKYEARSERYGPDYPENEYKDERYRSNQHNERYPEDYQAQSQEKSPFE